MLNIGIVGSGLIVSELVKEKTELSAFLTIVAMTSRPESVEKNIRDYGGLGIKICRDFDEMLAIEGIDTIYVAVPNHLHFSYSMKALQNKKHVICEKPLTPTAKEASELKAEAVAQGCMIFEAVTTLYSPNYNNIKEIVSNHQIGKIKLVECNYSQYSRHYDQFKRGTILPTFDPSMYGGALMDINSYNVHFIVGLFGKPDSFTYTANMEKGIDTSGTLVLKYPTCVCICTGAKDCSTNSHCYIQGDEGSVRTDTPSNKLTKYELFSHTELIESIEDAGTFLKFEHEFRFFDSCIQNQDNERFIQQMDHSILVMDILEQCRLRQTQ